MEIDQPTSSSSTSETAFSALSLNAAQQSTDDGNKMSTDASDKYSISDSDSDSKDKDDDSDSSDDDDSNPDGNGDKKDSKSNSTSSAATAAGCSAEDLLMGQACKENGNKEFSAKNNEEAIKHYSRGIELIGDKLFGQLTSKKKKTTSASAPKPAGVIGARVDKKKIMQSEMSQADLTARNELALSLNLNMAAALLKLEKYNEVIFYCDAALKYDSQSSKALFRRGIAYSRMGKYEEAKKDLTIVVEKAPEDKVALQELTAVRKKIAAIEKEQKEIFRNAFSKASEKGLYVDKEVQRKAQLLKERKEMLERKVMWEAENSRRKEVEEEPISFEEWELKEKAAAEEKKKKQAEEEAAREAAKQEAKKAATAATKASSNNGKADLVLDEDDLKAIEEAKKKGYNYHFTHTNKAKEQVKDFGQVHAPPKLDSERDLNSVLVSAPQKVASTEELGAGAQKVASAWNKNGNTWEERDVSEWARKRLKELIEKVPGVKSVSDITGDAQIIVSNGKRRNIWDMGIKKVSCEANTASGTKVSARFAFGEVSSTVSISANDYKYELSKYDEICDVPGTEENKLITDLGLSIKGAINDFISELMSR